MQKVIKGTILKLVSSTHAKVTSRGSYEDLNREDVWKMAKRIRKTPSLEDGTGPSDILILHKSMKRNA